MSANDGDHTPLKKTSTHGVAGPKALPIVRSPKLSAQLAGAQDYRYYAGYSDGFVEDILKDFNDTESALVLDPWNGSGTTTTIAASLGIDSLGFDINPVAVVLGRARLLGADIAGSIEPIAAEICNIAKSTAATVKGDLLETWFGPITAMTLRRLELSVRKLLVEENCEQSRPPAELVQSMSSLAAAFYVILFRLIRKVVKRYVTSNPTWIKAPAGNRLGIDAMRIANAFKQEAYLFSAELMSYKWSIRRDDLDGGSARVELSASYELPLAHESVSAIISSPPYCTRIDYVKATLPELAILGFRASDVRLLRDRMIGTPTITNQEVDRDAAYIGKAAANFLAEVRTHPSHASKTYYRKYYEQYFDGMAKSLTELYRVLQSSGRAVLVVQDSYYKDIHFDLAEAIGEMGAAHGWKEWQRIDFEVPRTMASINRASRLYRSSFKSVESALILHK